MQHTRNPLMDPGDRAADFRFLVRDRAGLSDWLRVTRGIFIGEARDGVAWPARAFSPGFLA